MNPECAKCSSEAEVSCMSCDEPLCLDHCAAYDEDNAICMPCDVKGREDHMMRMDEYRRES
jgi:hypothetical protein